MERAGWWLVAVVVFSVYAAVLLATVDGAIRAFRERYLPPWVVGLAATVLFGVTHGQVGTPLGSWGALLAILAGIAAGWIYGLRRRRLVSPGPQADTSDLLEPPQRG